MFSIRYNSPIILTFALACTVVFFLNQAFAQSLTPLISLSGHFNFSNPTDYLTLVTYIFGHNDTNHLMGNMTFILLLGPAIEEKYGSQMLFMMMLITAVVTGIFNSVFFETGLWGASGIVFMFIILVSFTNVREGGIPLTFILVLVLFVGKEVANSFKTNNISEFAHIAGGIIGSLFGFMRSHHINNNSNNRR